MIIFVQNLNPEIFALEAHATLEWSQVLFFWLACFCPVFHITQMVYLCNQPYGVLLTSLTFPVTSL